ncbi:MAG: hypothetical protein Q4A25_01990 [Candidatus Saccharibacteria bacterium]|nr:hypothetical protein [Candidatus Saccharibacteria bacterium]
MKTNRMFIGLGAAAMLGATIVPMTSYAAEATADVAVNLNVGSTISMAVDSASVTDDLSGASSSSAQTTTTTVTTNSISGYNLSATTSTNDGSLRSGDNFIAYVGSNFASETEGWALSVAGDPNPVFKDISGKNIADLGGADAPVDNDESVITYNFKIDGDTVSGAYKATLTYTATTN